MEQHARAEHTAVNMLPMLLDLLQQHLESLRFLLLVEDIVIDPHRLEVWQSPMNVMVSRSSRWVRTASRSDAAIFSQNSFCGCISMASNRTAILRQMSIAVTLSAKDQRGMRAGSLGAHQSPRQSRQSLFCHAGWSGNVHSAGSRRRLPRHAQVTAQLVKEIRQHHQHAVPGRPLPPKRAHPPRGHNAGALTRCAPMALRILRIHSRVIDIGVQVQQGMLRRQCRVGRPAVFSRCGQSVGKW